MHDEAFCNFQRPTNIFIERREPILRIEIISQLPCSERYAKEYLSLFYSHEY